jgi:hypothetical protein
MNNDNLHPDLCEVYHVEWTLDYTNWSDVRQLCEAVNTSCGRQIHMTLVWAEQKAIWTQTAPITHGRLIVNEIDRVAQILARRFGVRLLSPRLARSPAPL